MGIWNMRSLKSLHLSIKLCFYVIFLIVTQIKLANITAHLSINTQNHIYLYLPAARKITPKDSDCTESALIMLIGNDPVLQNAFFICRYFEQEQWSPFLWLPRIKAAPSLHSVLFQCTPCIYQRTVFCNSPTPAEPGPANTTYQYGCLQSRWMTSCTLQRPRWIVNCDKTP